MSAPLRQPKGVPVGGQYAENSHDAAGSHLADHDVLSGDADAATYLTEVSYALGVPIPPGASLHARKVLTRLANLSQIGA